MFNYVEVECLKVFQWHLHGIFAKCDLKVTPIYLSVFFVEFFLDKIVYINSAPLISSVKCLWENTEDGTVLLNRIVRITGNKLKIEGEKGGVYFCPTDSNGEPDDDETKWIKAVVTRNLPKTIELYVPENLEVGQSYALCIKTRPNADGIYSQGFSDSVTVTQ